MNATTGPNPGAAVEPMVRIEQVFDYPREAVFEAWTRADLLARWFAPEGCTIEFVRLDVRVGGGFHACVHNPRFGDCWTVGVYQDIVSPERLVFTMAIADATGRIVSPHSQGHDPAWPQETVVTVRFADAGGRTRVTLEQDVSEALAKRTGAHPSWIEMLGRLDAQLGSKIAAANDGHG